MRDYIIGAVVVVGAGLGVFFFPSSEPVKTYPLTMKEATRMLDGPDTNLKRVKFSGWRPYSYPAGGGVIEFIDRKSGSDAVCVAELEKEGDAAVSFEVSCPGAKTDGPLASYKTAVAEIVLHEAVNATLSDLPMNQAAVDAAFAKLDLSGLAKEDVLILESQSKFGRKPKGSGNKERAREAYAQHFNSKEGGGDAGWSADAAFNANEPD
ncbi:MAG: hypothetical protein AAFQ27_14060 [Pseudomonadota bacterium]